MAVAGGRGRGWLAVAWLAVAAWPVGCGRVWPGGRGRGRVAVAGWPWPGHAGPWPWPVWPATKKSDCDMLHGHVGVLLDIDIQAHTAREDRCLQRLI